MLPVSNGDVSKTRESHGHDQEDQDGKANQVESTVNMVNGILGAGLLGMPFTFKSCGLVLGLLLLSLCLYTSRISLLMLAQLGHSTGLRSYEELAQLAFGRTGNYAVNVCVVLLNIGNIIAYMNIFVDTVLWSFFSSKGWTPEDFVNSKATLMTVTAYLGMLPVGISVTSAKHMSRLAFFAITVYSFFCVFMTVRGLQSFLETQADSSASGKGGMLEGLVLWKPSGLIVAFPIMLYSYTAHNVIFPIYHNLKVPSLGNIKSVTESALSIVYTVYIVVGSSGYLMFRAFVQGDVLTNLGGEQTADFIKFFYGLTSLATVPILLIPIKACVFSMPLVKHYHRTNPSSLAMNRRGGLHVAIAVASLSVALICATLIPNIEYVFRLTGGSTCVTLGCILPSLIYLKLYHRLKVTTKHKVTRNVLFALATFGLVSGCLCTWSAVLAVDKADSEIRHHHYHHHHHQDHPQNQNRNEISSNFSGTRNSSGDEFGQFQDLVDSENELQQPFLEDEKAPGKEEESVSMDVVRVATVSEDEALLQGGNDVTGSNLSDVVLTDSDSELGSVPDSGSEGSDESQPSASSTSAEA